jgi:hypothetical protein
MNIRIFIILRQRASLVLQTHSRFQLLEKRATNSPVLNFGNESVCSHGKQKEKEEKSLTDLIFSKIETTGRLTTVLFNQQVAGPGQRLHIAGGEKRERWERHSFRLLSCYPAAGPLICW